ncbi:MAG: hypothetical protein WC895_05535 [Candidatus Shapirobacteria bacterium]|jgi:multidrug transporter EmrE-like cation transporter
MLTPRTTALLLTLLGGIILTLGDIAMKEWVSSSKTFFFIIGLLVYLIALCLLAFSYKFEDIAVASILLVLFNVVSLLLANQFLFHKPTTSLHIVGIVIALIAVCVLELA